MVMFKEKIDSLDGKTYSAKYSHAFISYTTDVYDPKVVVDYAATKNDSKNYYYDRATAVTTHAIFLSDKVDDIALSLALGNTIGIDFTSRLFGQTYLTGATSFYPGLQGEIIVQQRIYDGNPAGLSLGVTLNRNYQIVMFDSGSMVFPGIDGYYTTSAGVRLMSIIGGISSYGDARQFLYFTGSVNYDFQMKHIYPRLGISFGLY